MARPVATEPSYSARVFNGTITYGDVFRRHFNPAAYLHEHVSRDRFHAAADAATPGSCAEWRLRGGARGASAGILPNFFFGTGRHRPGPQEPTHGNTWDRLTRARILANGVGDEASAKQAAYVDALVEAVREYWAEDMGLAGALAFCPGFLAPAMTGGTVGALVGGLGGACHWGLARASGNQFESLREDVVDSAAAAAALTGALLGIGVGGPVGGVLHIGLQAPRLVSAVLIGACATVGQGAGVLAWSGNEAFQYLRGGAQRQPEAEPLVASEV